MNIAIVGGGPAGLRAAEVASAGGASVTLFDAKPSVGRKFLVAGRGGLNITKAESRELFVTRYTGPEQPPDFWPSLIGEFDPDALRAWAAGLGVETFAASTGRVYPREMKAAPLLRRWVQRLKSQGVQFAMNHRWTELQHGTPLRLGFQTDSGTRYYEADALILALGGGSWPETGSDGKWITTLQQLGISVAPLEPANCGWETTWSMKVLRQAEGKPLKNIAARAGNTQAVGELLVTSYGLEGGAIYQLGSALRAMPSPEISIDFKPSSTIEQLVAKMGPVRRNFLAEARQRWRLDDAAGAIISYCMGDSPLTSATDLAEIVKNCKVSLTGPRPIAEAISSAGGVRWKELDRNLMLKRFPGVFVAGEMIDWEAPTGGYLMQGCFASGTHVGNAALRWLQAPR
ncbi:NAD(P)/FAD-dependent oxidoreductase [Verrucomicrobiota bacterium sgz303538]